MRRVRTAWLAWGDAGERAPVPDTMSKSIHWPSLLLGVFLGVAGALIVLAAGPCDDEGVPVKTEPQTPKPIGQP